MAKRIKNVSLADKGDANVRKVRHKAHDDYIQKDLVDNKKEQNDEIIQRVIDQQK